MGGILVYLFIQPKIDDANFIIEEENRRLSIKRDCLIDEINKLTNQNDAINSRVLKI